MSKRCTPSSTRLMVALWSVWTGALTACTACTAAPDVADIAVVECQPPVGRNAIVNGALTGQAAFGEVGTLFGVGVGHGERLGSGLCSATLIAPDVVVTAAHCVGGFPAHRIRISTHPCPGPNDLENLADLRYVAVHPDWDGDDIYEHQTPAQRFEGELVEALCQARVGHADAALYWACIDSEAPDFFKASGLIDGHTSDLAIAILDRPLQTTPLARLPADADAQQPIQAGSRLTAVGYGVAGREADGGLTTGDRYVGRVAIDEVGLEELRVNFAAARICSGDSGGPLLQQIGTEHILVGVGVRIYPSHAEHIDLCDGPGVATHVQHYTPWIRATLRQACLSGQRTHEMCSRYPI